MKKLPLNLVSTVISLNLLACGGESLPSSQLSTIAGQDSCEITKQLIEVPESHFPRAAADVITVIEARAKANCSQGGLGWRINSWSMSIEVQVKNMAFDKRFTYRLAGASIWDRAMFDLSEVQYLGSHGDGFDRFRLTRSVSRLEPFQLSVIMPAQYNSTPNIGNPMPGWTGPTYGLSVAVGD